MATQMIHTGAVQFKGSMIELGKPYLVSGRKGVPFLAWVRDGMSNLPNGFAPKPSTTIRFKWDNTYMPSDFIDVFGKQVTITPIMELAAA